MKVVSWIAALALMNLSVQAQHIDSPSLDSLKQEILKLRTDVEAIQINLAASETKFKRGIFVATVGYSATIAGGLMLGRRNDDLGKALLITGGATGVTGTALMLDAFKYLGRAGRSRKK